MKEMKYYPTTFNSPEILDEGDYRNYHYIIANMGTHPCCYVEDKLFTDDTYAQELTRVHGGVTWEHGELWWKKGDHREYFGWDYAHCGDFYGADLLLFDGISATAHMYTTQELKDDVLKAIDEIVDAQ